MAAPRRSLTGGPLAPQMNPDAPPPLPAPTLVDTAVWTWVRDRRRPDLAIWFNREATSGRVLVCDLVIVELIRLAPNSRRAEDVAERLAAFESVPMPGSLWPRARELQRKLAAAGTHRGVPPADLLIAATALEADVELLHYDGDYEAIGAVSALRHRWLVERGAL
jgi:predicted nucleic acid-binding protein